jgi:cytochrome c-type biogenesis protein CcsB
MNRFLNAVYDNLFSMKAGGIYIAAIAIAIGVATFIENDYGTSSAQSLIYRAKWFELLLLLFSGALLANIFRHNLVKKRKWGSLILHTSILVIILGSAITRYISYEGMMGIREGSSSNKFLSADDYLKFKVIHDGKSYSFDERVGFSSLGRNSFKRKYQIGPHIFDVKLLEFIPNPGRQLVNTESGKPVVKLVAAQDSGREDQYIFEGERVNVAGVDFNFTEERIPGAINFSFDGDRLMFDSDSLVTLADMMTQRSDTISSGELAPVLTRVMYFIGRTGFVVTDFFPKGEVVYVSTDRKMSSSNFAGLNMRISKDGDDRVVFITGGSGAEGFPGAVEFDDVQMLVSYGAKTIQLPFSIFLREFEKERYPGTDNPSSYASEVTLIDPSSNVNRDFRIYMNNILNYGGYRFFQSSYDRDELGTYLSVNYDYWGTLFSYIGYFLLTIGMIMTYFEKNSRFTSLLKRTNRYQDGLLKTLAFFVVMTVASGSSILASDPVSSITREQAAELGRMTVQDYNGRLKPMNTMSNEVLRKISRKEKLYGLTSDQIMWSMMIKPMEWQYVPVIDLGRIPELRDIIGTTERMASFSQFFNEAGQYKLMEHIRKSQAVKPVDQNMFDKAIIKLDEKVNITSMILARHFLRIFPYPDHPGYTWVTPTDIRMMEEPEAGLPEMLNIFDSFISSDAIDNELVSDFVASIAELQLEYSEDILPGEEKINAELLLNKINVFGNLTRIYGLLSLLALFFFFYSVFRAGNSPRLTKIIWALAFIFFLIHTFGLGLRWYVSERAPWSNGYESMIYIGWATLLAGLLLSRKSLGGIAATLVLAATILSVAGMSWLDPEITPLVPVLKSYWLTIHVSVIAGSYGFLLLGAVIGILNLILISFAGTKSKERIMGYVKDLSSTSEIVLLAGLMLMVTGTYLGGIWANESWGRYWGWDAKETWSLVTILVYSFILHMRLIPGLKSIYAYNVATLFGFASVIMTYFGVNYYLSGLHSYAAGDPVPIPPPVFYTVIILTLLSIAAYFRYRKIFAVEQESS